MEGKMGKMKFMKQIVESLSQQLLPEAWLQLFPEYHSA